MEDRDLLAAFEEKYPEHLTSITPERLETIAEVCRQVHGEAFARACLARIEETGHITPVQRYFGLHYRANLMPTGNRAYLELMKQFGFYWFEEWQPAEDDAG